LNELVNDVLGIVICGFISTYVIDRSVFKIGMHRSADYQHLTIDCRLLCTVTKCTYFCRNWRQRRHFWL